MIGAGGGLGRNVVDAAHKAKHRVVALVRDPERADLPPEVDTIVGDATRIDDLVRAMTGADAAMFCVMPRFAAWLTEFPSLLECGIVAARRTDSRLVFPANVWIFGPGRPGERVSETRAPSPTSRRGRLRAEMEQRIREAGIRHAILRLPEFYGPRVLTLTARIFRAALSGRSMLWPGPIDLPVEFVFMPDAASALLAVGTARDCDAGDFHLPGAETTVRQFADVVLKAAGRRTRMIAVPRWLLSAGGAFHPTIRGVADIAHLWTDPILLEGAKYASRFGPPPVTPLADAVGMTMAWHRAHPDLRLQA